MGAISSILSLPILKKYLNDTSRTVRETCDIAIAKIEWDHSEEGQRHLANETNEPQSVAAVSASCTLPHLPLHALQNIYLRRPCAPDFRPSCWQDRNCDSIQRKRAALEAS